MGLKDSTIKAVRSVPLTEVLQAEGIAYKKIGREAVTLCPWHADTNPSLTINDDKNLCFCFACGGGKDAIDYVQQKFGLGFVDAVNRIADKHSIQVEYDNLDPEEALRLAAERKRALGAVQRQQDAFRQALRGDAGVLGRDWLRGRGIKPETSREFELGYATNGYFGGRVTVPIHNHRGTLVGFTGRRVQDGPDADPQKYKNSASSDIFDKGALLFNEHRAIQAARSAGYVVFVEGHFDVISMHQYGMQNVVATQGTAGPSLEAIRRLLRQCRRFVLCYDGDDGGLKAIEHFIKVAGPLACAGEMTLTVAQMPSGKDPDDCIRSGVDLYSIIESAPQWLDWQIDCWLAGLDRSDVFRFSQVEQAIRDLVQSIKSPALRQYYVDKSAKVLAADPKAAAKLAQSWMQSVGRSRTNAKWSKPSPDWVRNQAERRLLRCYVHFPESRGRLKPLGDLLQSPSHIWLWNRLMELEQCAGTIQPEMVKALLVVAEPHYLRALRPLVMPTIQLHSQDGILEHVENVLGNAKFEVQGVSSAR
jgi:DNA primase